MRAGIWGWPPRAALLVAFIATAARALEVDCTNAADDDVDGLTDCADDDCALDGTCVLRADREFRLVRDADGRAWQNLYYVSWPEKRAVQDIANTASATPNKCVGSAGPPAGPTSGDSIINADDLLCTVWAGRGQMTIQRWIRDDVEGLPATGLGCSPDIRSAELTTFGIRFTGNWTEPLVGVEGFTVSVSDSRGIATHVNPASLLGWCDDSWPGLVIESHGCEPVREFLQLRYGTLYRTVDEILCGLEGFDWTDADLDGDPDDCPNGIFDGQTQISVATFDNDPDTQPETDNQFVTRTVFRALDGSLVFLGRDFGLEKGFAYRVDACAGQQPRLWLPPHDGVNCR